MNFIFGTIGPHADAICRRVEDHAHSAYGTATSRVDAGHATFMASTSELSIATVRADGEDSIALIGMVQTEFEELAHDDPMIDIERTAEGRRRYEESGIGVIPIIHINGEVLVGFNRDEVLQTLVAEDLYPLEGI